MNKQKTIYLISALTVLLLTSACGNQTSSGSADNGNTVPTATEPAKTDANDSAANSDKEILIIIDQTLKPIEGNSFDFVVNQRPEGFALAEMQWVSKNNTIVNSIQEAIEHGGNGEDGFYISGNGQFMGFFYPDTMKGEEGQVVFLFKDAGGKELTWKKEITLK